MNPVRRILPIGHRHVFYLEATLDRSSDPPVLRGGSVVCRLRKVPFSIAKNVLEQTTGFGMFADHIDKALHR